MTVESRFKYAVWRRANGKWGEWTFVAGSDAYVDALNVKVEQNVLGYAAAITESPAEPS